MAKVDTTSQQRGIQPCIAVCDSPPLSRRSCSFSPLNLRRPPASRDSPTGPDDWATFTAAEKKAALEFQWRRLRSDLSSNTAVVQTAYADTLTTGGVGVLTVTVDYNCPIQWITYPHGEWTRGGGFTQASSPISTIYASQPGTYIGRLRRDGVDVEYWYHYTHNTDRAESWSPYNWRWAWEHPTYSNVGYHGAYNGSWLLGPNQFCTVSRST